MFDAEFAAARERARVVELPRAQAPIVGRDRDAGAIGAARANAERAGVDADVDVRQAAISALEPDSGAGWSLPIRRTVRESASARHCAISTRCWDASFVSGGRTGDWRC